MTTEAPSQQVQSRLLSLPRELRDEIYTYYLQEPGGYAHSPITNKLRHSNGQIIDFSLMWTCKLVADEMRDLPLKVNEVVFRPFQEIKTSQEGSNIWDAWSQAGKFDFLLERLYLLQEEMFALAATTYDTTSVTTHISQHHPESCIGDIMARIMKHANKDYVPLAAVMGGPQTMTYYDREVIQGSLIQLTSHAGFAERLRSWGWFIDILGFLTSSRPPLSRSTHLIQWEKRSTAWYRVGTDSVFRAEHDVSYAEQLSLMRLEEMRLLVAQTNWQPWVVATDEEMSRLRDLFETPCPRTWSSYEDNLPSLQYFQSAASQAIRFVNTLQIQSRKQMRQIKILEDEKCVALPQCHLRGLLSVSDEAHGLSVDRHVDLWRCVFPHDYGKLAEMSKSQHMEDWWADCRVSDAVLRTITWINEATSLSWGRNTHPPFKTQLIGPFDTVQLIWNKVKDVAALYTAAMACTHAQRSPFPTRDDLALAFANEGDAACSDPELLPTSVKHILSGNSLVQFPCIIGTLDEFEEECQYVSKLLQDRPKEDWEAYRNSILEGVIEEEGVDYKTVQSRYADHRPSFD